MGVEIRAFEARDLARFAYTLRDMDAAEVFLSHGGNAFDVLRTSSAASSRCFVAEVRSTPLAAFGVAPVAPGIGSVWLLGTVAVERFWVGFLRSCRDVLPRLVAGFSYVENHVWAEYRKALAWARWLGFTVEPAEPWGVAGAPFHRIWMEA